MRGHKNGGAVVGRFINHFPKLSSCDWINASGWFIQENDLQSIGASKALSVAYRAVTGKNMGENSEKSYDTKKVKENLGRPGSGSGKGKETIDLKNMSLEDFRKNEKEIYAQVMAQAGRE